MTRKLRFLLIFISIAACRPSNGIELACAHLPQIVSYFLKHHYLYKTLNDSLKKNTVEQFIKTMDPSKTLFLEEDVAQIRAKLPHTFATMESGKCGTLDEIYALILKRTQENEQFVKTFLNKDYKLDENAEIALDPKKRVFAKMTTEREAHLKRNVHFQILNSTLSDTKLEEAKKNLVHRYELATKRISKRKASDAYVAFAEAFAMALDPHSTFLSPDNMEDFRIQMQLSLEGIGASLRYEDGYTVIESLIPGGQADRSKMLLPKDKIIAVAQEGQTSVSVIDMELREVVKLIRGRKGTKVKLTILRQGEGTKTFDVSIIRDKIDIKDQAAKLTYETRKVGTKTYKIGILDLPSFYGGGDKGSRSCSTDVKMHLLDATNHKVDALVLNLARNGGGLLEEAVRIAGFFIRKGAVVATKDTQTKVQVLADDDDGIEYNGPLIVVTSRLSASASEILAGALKDYHRAVVVGGDHTFGKGTVQILSGFPLDIGGMKVTTGMFFVPGGSSTQHIGVQSDISMPSPFNTDDIGEKALDYSLPPQKIPNFLSKDANFTDAEHQWKEIDDVTVAKLAAKSKERVDKEAKFKEISKNLEETEKNGGIVKLSEIKKKSLAEKKKEKKEPKSAKKRIDEKINEIDQPIVSEAVSIAADLVSVTSPLTRASRE